MTGRSAEEIRQAPLPRLTGRTPAGFSSSARINRDLDRALRLPDGEELKQLLWVLAALAGILLMAYVVCQMSVQVPVEN